MELNISTSAVSIPGSGVTNEDVWGMSGNFFWVIDGVTGLVPNRLTIRKDTTDSAIFATEVSSQMKIHAHTSTSPSDLLERAISTSPSREIIERRFTRDLHYQPSFTIAIVYIASPWVHVAVLGDCFVHAKIATRVLTMTDRRVERVARATAQARKEAIARGAEDSLVADAVRAQVHLNRMRMNTPGGYFVGTADRKGIYFVRIWRLSCDTTNSLILCTDGFQERLQDQDISVILTGEMELGQYFKPPTPDNRGVKAIDDATALRLSGINEVK